jgi:glycosyltransferase 2 family protein
LLKSRGFWIGITISVILILLFVRSTPVGDMKRAFEDANPWIALASLPVYFLGLWVRTIRWQYLLRPVKRVTTLRLYPVVIIGLMANNLIPARAGELARAYVLGERERVSKTAAFGTIAVDRIFDGVTLIPLMLIVAAFAGGDASFPVGFHKSLNFAGLGIVMAVLFGVAIAVLFYMALSERGRDLLHRLVLRFAPRRVKPMVEGLLHSFFDGLGALRSPIDLGVAWLMSLISWSLEATMYYIVARAFGIDEPFYVFLLLTAAANLAIAIVASQGGIGPFEIVVSRTIVAFGASVNSADANAYALGLHAILLIPVVAIGLALMWSMNLTFGAMLRGERQTEADTEALAIEEDAASRSARPSNPIVEGGRK